MAHGKCLNCSAELDRHGCPRCDDPVQRLEKLRASQLQFRRDLKAGKVTFKRPPKKQQGGYFMQQCRQTAEQRAARLAQLPVSGQDAALPPGDR